MKMETSSFVEEKVLGPYTLQQLKTEKFFHFLNTFSEKELENIKHISNNSIIIIESYDHDNTLRIIETLIKFNKINEVRINFPDKKNYKNIFEIIKKINSLYKKCQFTIDIQEHGKNELYKSLVSEVEFLKELNISFREFTNEIDLKSYFSYEKRLFEMIEPAIEFSPLEKYLFAYNIVKKFKPYKDSVDDKELSRKLYRVLDSEFMVCQGYSELLGDLLDKLEIPNKYYHVEIDTSFDYVPIDTHVVTENMFKHNKKGNHARRIVHIVDLKYGVNGIFFADPTWDNVMEYDTYNYALMTPDEYNGIKRYNYLDWHDIKEMLFVHNLEEFYQKANIWMNKNISNKVESDFIRKIIVEVKDLDEIFYQDLCRKYPKIATRLSIYTKEEIQSIMFELGNYIISKVNNPVTGLQLKEAITFLYENCYGISDKEDLQKCVDEILLYNKKRQHQCFPIRIKQNSLGGFTLYQNTENKFEFIRESKNKKS